MLLLSATTDKLQLVTFGTCNLDVITTFTDRNQSTFTVGLSDRKGVTITTGTSTDIVVAPGATTTRCVQSILIRNASATVVAPCVLLYNANATLRELGEFTLFPQDQISWTQERGWSRLPASTRFNKFVCGAGLGQQGLDSQTMTTLPGLSIYIPASTVVKTYNFEACIIAKTAVGTTGARFGLHESETPAASPTAVLMTGLCTVTTSVSAAALGTGQIGSFGSAPVNQTTGPTVDSLFRISGYFKFAAAYDTSVAVCGLTEVAGSFVTVQLAGSWFQIWEATG